jgi:hypothetical protein
VSSAYPFGQWVMSAFPVVSASIGDDGRRTSTENVHVAVRRREPVCLGSRRRCHPFRRMRACQLRCAACLQGRSPSATAECRHTLALTRRKAVAGRLSASAPRGARVGLCRKRCGPRVSPAVHPGAAFGTTVKARSRAPRAPSRLVRRGEAEPSARWLRSRAPRVGRRRAPGGDGTEAGVGGRS